MHLIDTSTGKAGIAYAGETPWHGLGQQLTAGADIETWVREAGLEWDVALAPVLFQHGEVTSAVEGRRVTYRTDTGAPLGIVGDDYRVVQPRAVVEWFRDLTEAGGFTLDVAGSLNGGRRVWALAQVGEGATVIGQDEVRPYLLLATSFDGTMSTTAKFTAIRVVCNNTITIATGVGHDGKLRDGEKDKTDGPVVTCVRIPHSATFDGDAVKRQLGIVRDAFDEFLIKARLLAETKVDERFVVEFLKSLLPKPATDGQVVEDGYTFKRLMATWKGEVPSATLPEAQGTAWGLLNAITWDVDHVRGRDASRLNSAWFGTGDGLKSRALDLLSKVVA